jgi:hypothetical protein
MVVHAGKLLNLFLFGRHGETSTTIQRWSTLQAYGSGSGLPLARNGEGEEIVFARLEREWLLA